MTISSNAIFGFETGAVASELINVPVGTAAFSTVQARTGSRSLRCNPASGASGYVNLLLGTGWGHFGLYVATMPTVARTVVGFSTSNNLLLNTDGTLSVRNTTTVIGTSSTALTTGVWYWIGYRNANSVTGVLLQIDGVDQVSGTTGASLDGTLGCTGTEASAIDIYFDDVLTDNAGFLAPSKVALCVPISDNTIDAGWTNDAAGTTNLFNAVKNIPPQGIADTTGSTGLHQIRDATTGLDTYVANLTTYANAGVGPSDTILAVVGIIVSAAPVGTSAKNGSLTISNPTYAKTSFTTFWSGVAAGTFPTGWKNVQADSAFGLVSAPTVTIANSPVMTITQDTSSTRIAMVCFMGMYVAWTPAAVAAAQVPYTNPMIPLLAQ